jgi:hypothetical protein
VTATMNIKRTVVGIVFALVAMGVLSSPALAYLNSWYDLSDYYSTDADVRMSGFKSPGTSYGYIWINNYGRTACTYVQRKPVADLALDDDWKRSTPRAPVIEIEPPYGSRSARRSPRRPMR